MFKETFALFQPGLWQEEGLIITVVTGAENENPRVFRKMEKWLAATTAAVAMSVALVGASPAHASFTTGDAGAARRFVIGMMKEGAGSATIQDAEVSADYWSRLATEVATWPRLSLNGSSDVEPEPIV
jgi:hypothetical protein